MLNRDMTELLFTKKEWEAAMPTVVAGMKSFLSSYRTPVFEDHKEGDGWGSGCGSGSYLQLGKRRFVLTNEHVAGIRRKGRLLGYQFLNQDDLHRVVGDHFEYAYPLDLALLPVSDAVWSMKSHGSRTIEIDQIALAHDPCPGELLTFTGFSGNGTHFLFNTLCSEGTCYTAREVDLPVGDSRFNSRFHFGLDYRPDQAVQVDGNSGLRLPPGLSGSTVWNTRFVAAKMAGRTWCAEMAQVTGVVWGWPSSAACLVVTRSEYLRSFLLEVRETLSEVPMQF
jgi:hypothetical protein